VIGRSEHRQIDLCQTQKPGNFRGLLRMICARRQYIVQRLGEPMRWSRPPAAIVDSSWLKNYCTNLNSIGEIHSKSFGRWAGSAWKKLTASC
jgi:hypothetical protein